MTREHAKIDHHAAPFSIEPIVVRVRGAEPAVGLLWRSVIAVVVAVLTANVDLRLLTVLREGLAMRHRYVVTLDKILDQVLPVRLPLERFPKQRLVKTHAVAADDAIAERRKRRLRLRARRLGQRNVNETFPAITVKRPQAVLVAIEVRVHLHVRRAQQFAGGIISPGVIAAGKTLRRTACLIDQAGETMRAGIDESADLTILLAHQQHRHARDFMGQKVAGLRYLVGATDTDPLRAEHPGLLVCVEGERVIDLGRYRPGLLE